MAFLLPALGAAATAVGHGAAALAPAALGALKGIGGAALTGAKALGGGIFNAAKGMLGGGSGGAIGSAKQALVPGLQNIGQQAAGAVPEQVATGGLGAAKPGMLDALLRTIGKTATDKKEETPATLAEPSIIGGEGPIGTSQIPQFAKQPSMGELIARMLTARRGF